MHHKKKKKHRKDGEMERNETKLKADYGVHLQRAIKVRRNRENGKQREYE